MKSAVQSCISVNDEREEQDQDTNNIESKKIYAQNLFLSVKDQMSEDARIAEDEIV